jgi:multiple sugar transport system ATP-binding protein
MRSELKALHQRLKTTTVYVTHDQEEAMTLGDLVVVMANGDIQQAGTPDEVFRSPLNRFVAGFVGMPPMNFLDGALRAQGERMVWLESGKSPVEIVLPDHLTAHAKPLAGQACVLGIRPGAISVQPDAPHDLSFLVTVAVVEPLGEQTDLRLTTPSGELLTARVPSVHGHMPKVGETVRVAIDPARVHAFEPGPFGRALDAPANPTPVTTQPEAA